MKKMLMVLVLQFLLARVALAVPDTVSARVADVTTSSFSLVWMTDCAAAPDVELYADAGMATRLSDGITFTAMPDAPDNVAAAAKARGVMKVRVSGLAPSTRYFARTVTRDPGDLSNVGYSGVLEVVTASEVTPFVTAQDESLQGFANDLATMRVYVQPNDTQASPGLGDLLILETASAGYPLSAFVGADASAPEGIIDLNNLFDGQSLTSLWARGGETVRLRVYRGGTLATLQHYRRLASNGGQLTAVEPLKGFFADINLDGKVDDSDFEEFKKQYRTSPNDDTYNPDFKFVTTSSGKIDAQDFTRFAKEYGRTNVPQQ